MHAGFRPVVASSRFDDLGLSQAARRGRVTLDSTLTRIAHDQAAAMAAKDNLASALWLGALRHRWLRQSHCS
jgi:hypothetical protein